MISIITYSNVFRGGLCSYLDMIFVWKICVWKIERQQNLVQSNQISSQRQLWLTDIMRSQVRAGRDQIGFCSEFQFAIPGCKNDVRQLLQAVVTWPHLFARMVYDSPASHPVVGVPELPWTQPQNTSSISCDDVFWATMYHTTLKHSEDHAWQIEVCVWASSSSGKPITVLWNAFIFKPICVFDMLWNALKCWDVIPRHSPASS